MLQEISNRFLISLTYLVFLPGRPLPAWRQRAILIRSGLRSMPPAEYLKKLPEYDAQVRQLNKLFSLMSPFYAARLMAERADFSEIQESLAEDTALIIFVRFVDVRRSFLGAEDPIRNQGDATFPSGYLALVARRNTPPRVVELGDADKIDALIDRVTEEITSGPLQIAGFGEEQAIERLVRHSRELSTLLVDPLWSRIKNASKLIIVPDGKIAGLQCALLTIPHSQKFLIDDHVVSYLEHPADLLYFGPGQQNSGIAYVFADPEYDALPAAVEPESGQRRQLNVRRMFAPLPGALREGRQIRQRLEGMGIRVQLKTKHQATAKELLRLEQPRILHVATHGFYLEDATELLDSLPINFQLNESGVQGLWTTERQADPMLRSGIALAGANRSGQGIVSAYELGGLNLQGTDLVVLSACESGLGMTTTGSGILGLRRSLAISGARSSIISLWTVPDAETADLMDRFYRLYGANNRQVSESLRQAMFEMRKVRRDQKGHAHPYYWGAFIVSGDPD